MSRRKTARKYVEFLRLQFEHHGARYPGFLARCIPHSLGEAADHRLSLFKRDILRESVLGRDRLRRPIRNDRIVIDSASQRVQSGPVAAEAILKHRQLNSAQVADSLDP